MNGVAAPAELGGQINGSLLILGVMVAGGAAGGWAAYHQALGDDPSKRGGLLRFLLTGLVAAACVPLFLSLTKSDIVSNIIGNVDPVENALVFAGLCLLAGFLSRRFLERLADKVLAEAREAKAEAKIAQETAEQALEVADESGAVETTKSTAPADIPDQPAFGGDLADDELKALRALSKMTFRTASGIAADINMPRHHISELLDSLDSKGLIELTKSPKTGGPRWRMTGVGVATLRERSKSTS